MAHFTKLQQEAIYHLLELPTAQEEARRILAREYNPRNFEELHRGAPALFTLGELSSFILGATAPAEPDATLIIALLDEAGSGLYRPSKGFIFGEEAEALTEQAEVTARAMVEYYSHEDFYSNYSCVLGEYLLQEGEGRIKHLVKRELWEKEPTPAQIEKVIEHISKNQEEYTRNYSGYYAPDSIASVCFGEQEEERPEYLTDEAGGNIGFYLPEDREYMYYNLEAEGLYIPCTEGIFYSALFEAEGGEK